MTRTVAIHNKLYRRSSDNARRRLKKWQEKRSRKAKILLRLWFLYLFWPGNASEGYILRLPRGEKLALVWLNYYFVDTGAW